MAVNNMSPKFSVILPVRNGGEHIKLCVSSILDQTYINFELLILENCSVDGTANWLKKIQDPRVKIFPSKESLSLEDNWARISSIKTSEFLTIIGHDDLLDTNYLEVMSKLIIKHPLATLYHAHFRYIDTNGAILRHCLPMCETQKMYEYVAMQFLQTLDSTGTGYMMRRKDFDLVGGFNQYSDLIFGDYELWVKLIDLGYLATEPSECFSYREHSSASTKVKVVNYQSALSKYLIFLNKKSETNILLRNVIDKYGKNFLNYLCTDLILKGISLKRDKFSKPASEIKSDFDILFYKTTRNCKSTEVVNQRLKMLVLIDSWIIGRLGYIFLLKIKSLIKNNW